MKITAIRESTISVGSAMRTASIGFEGMTASVLVVESDLVRFGRPVVGLALDSVGRYGHGGLLRERFIPRLLAADPNDYCNESDGLDPQRAWHIIMRNEKLGGHGERAGAVGLLDAALWDLASKIEDCPLWALLHRRFGNGAAHTRIPVYASGGHYQSDNDLDRLAAEIRGAVDRGHDHIKVKIGAIPLADDLHRIDFALEQAGSAHLALDGNGTFDRTTMRDYAAALSSLDLAWLEEPVDPLDYKLHGELAALWTGVIATGENLFSLADVRNLIRYGGLRSDRDLLQVDISLSYGLTEYARILAFLNEEGWSRRRCVPHAGHLLALNAVAGLGLGRFEVASDPASLFGALPKGTTIADGHAMLGDFVGAGFEATPELMKVFRPLVDAH